MCHAMSTRNRPCRRRGSEPVTLTRLQGVRETFSTGLCSLHRDQLERTGVIDLWRPHHALPSMPLCRITYIAATGE